MNRKKVISIFLVIMWMIFIFLMSSFDATESSSQSGFIVDIICNIFNISNIDMISFIIRKFAHFTEYFILGLLVFNMIRCYDKKMWYAIIICILYAISDEVHQMFVPGRSCQLTDVMIDSFGSIIGIYLLRFKFNKKNI